MRFAWFAAALGVALALGALPASAHTSDRQFWTSTVLTGRFEQSPWQWSVDVQARFSDDNKGVEQTSVRPALGYRVREGLDLWVGYADITTHRDGNDVEEQRFWQQANYALGDFAGGAVSGRTRVEQRFRSSGDDAGWRVRQQLRYANPIEGTPLSIVLSNETMFTLNETDWGQRSGFDQNRAMAGVQWRVNDGLRIEAGYLNQYSNGVSADRVSHNLVLNTTLRF
ncbi:MAG: DUF2490 domain-containing protein [Hyphomonadaceae bacterium]|nr:DUF2490 domain-containing protein [Hyphomonadaceae bacterium]